MSNVDWPQHPGQASPNKGSTSLPPELAAVALVDAPTAALVGAMSVSWWLDKVAAGIAPQPVIRSTRCTRWRMEAVAAFWRDFGAQSKASDTLALKARATKASAAARAKRSAGASGAAK